MQSCALAPLRGEPLQAAYCRSPEYSAQLRRLVAGGRFDVIHVEHLRAAHLLFEIPRHVPVLYDAVDSIALLLERTLRGSHSLKQRAIAALELARTRMYERRALTRADATIVTSEDDADALRRLAPNAPISVLPNGVDLDYFHPVEAAGQDSTIVISGKMSYHANVTAVLSFVHKTLPLIRQRHPGVRLRVVGSDPPATLRALTRDPLIEVTGYVSDVRPAIQSAAVAVCPVTVKVGIQNKILEAMALGIPVVSTKAGAVGLRAQAGQDVLVGEDDRAVAALVGSLLNDRHLQHEVGAAGRRYVETHHQWERIVDRLERAYHEAISRVQGAARP
jgi:glycosyltransferase involved in cell wall biosynthesis